MSKVHTLELIEMMRVYLSSHRMQCVFAAAAIVCASLGLFDLGAFTVLFALTGTGGSAGEGDSDAGGGWGVPDCPNGAVDCIGDDGGGTSPPSSSSSCSSCTSCTSCTSCSSCTSCTSCRSLVVTYLHQKSGKWVHIDTIEPRYARPSTSAVELPAAAFDNAGNAQVRISATKRHRVSGIAFANISSAQSRQMTTLALQTALLERTQTDYRDILASPFDGRYVNTGPGDVLTLAFAGEDGNGSYKLQIKEIEPELSAYDHITLNRIALASDERLVVRSDFSAPLVFKSSALAADAHSVGLVVRDNHNDDLTQQLTHRYLCEEAKDAGGVEMTQGTRLEITLTGGNPSEGGYLLLESWYRDWTLGDIYEREGVPAFQRIKSPFTSQVRRGLFAGVLGSIFGLLGAGSGVSDSNSSANTLANAFFVPTVYADHASCSSCTTSTPFVYTWNGRSYVMDNDVMFGKPISRFDSLAAGKRAYEARTVTPDLYCLQNTIATEHSKEDGHAYLLSFGGVYTYASRIEQQQFGKWTSSLDDQALAMLSEVYHYSHA